MSSRSRPQEEAPKKPNTRGKGQSRVCFRVGWVEPLSRVRFFRNQPDPALNGIALGTWACELSGTRNDDVVRSVRFAVRAEGTEGVVILLAVVLIGTMPGVDTDYAGQVARAEVIDQD